MFKIGHVIEELKRIHIVVYVYFSAARGRYIIFFFFYIIAFLQIVSVVGQSTVLYIGGGDKLIKRQRRRERLPTTVWLILVLKLNQSYAQQLYYTSSYNLRRIVVLESHLYCIHNITHQKFSDEEILQRTYVRQLRGVQNDNTCNNYNYTYNIGEYPSAKLRIFM